MNLREGRDRRIIRTDRTTYSWTATKDGSPFTTGGGANWNFTPTDQGTYQVGLTISDPAGGSIAAVPATVSISNRPPQGVSITAPDTCQQDLPVALRGAAVDVAADTLSYAWTVTRGGQVVATGSGADWSFTPDEHAIYLVSLVVSDEDGGSSDPVQVEIAPSTTLVVTTLSDDPQAGYTLREAIADANDATGLHRIVFSDALDFSAAIDISLTGGQIAITDDLEILGPGASLLTVSGGGLSRVFSATGSQTDLSVTGLSITGGAASDGAAILATDIASLALSNVSLIGNTATGSGGAVSLTGTTSATIENSLFSQNTAYAGGAIAVGSGASLVLLDSTLTGNTAVGFGGAILAQGASHQIVNATLVANQATGDAGTFTLGQGGGLYVDADTGSCTVMLSTIAANSADQGGGIRLASGDLLLAGMIVAQNTAAVAGPDIEASIAIAAASAYNLIGDGAGASGITHAVNGNQVGTTAAPIDPLFEVDSEGALLLANNGGSVPTLALQKGSPAIDAAWSSVPLGPDDQPIALDARGQLRLAGAAIDCGAFEATVAEPAVGIWYEPVGPTDPGTFRVISGQSQIVFADVPLDQQTLLRFRIRNTGAQTLLLDLDQIQLPAGVWMPSQPYGVLQPGEDLILELLWDAQSELSDSVVIPTNDPVHEQFSIPLAGTVAIPAGFVPLAVSECALSKDTGTSDTDLVTANPAVAIQLAGDLLRGVARIEFDHVYTDHAADGLADGFLYVEQTEQPVSYDPRSFDTTWPAPTSGSQAAALRYRLVHVNEFGRVLSTGDWTQFDYMLTPASSACGLVVSNLARAKGYPGDWTTPGAVAVTGHVDGSGTRSVQVAVDGKTCPEAVGLVDAYGNFKVEMPMGFAYGATSTISVRAFTYSAADQMNVYGAWSTLSVTPAPAAVSSLSYDTNRTDSESQPLPDALVGYLADGIDSRLGEVEFFYESGGQPVVVGQTWTDENSAFICVPHHLPAGQAVTVFARRVIRCADGTTIYGPTSQGVSVTYEPSETLYVSSLALTEPDPLDATKTASPAVRAVASAKIGAAVLFEFSWSSDGGTTYTQAVTRLGSMVYNPNLPADATRADVDAGFRIPSLEAGTETTLPIRMRVRAGYWDAVAGGYVFGEYRALDFTYCKPVDALPVLSSLALGDVEPEVTTTETAMLVGTVTNDGSMAGLEVELYQGTTLVDRAVTDAEGHFTCYPSGLAAGSVTLTAKVREWNAVSRQYQYSQSASITFTYAPPVVAAPQLASFTLGDDTGTLGDNTTSHALLKGSVTDDGQSRNRLRIELDYNGDTVADDTTYTDAAGAFHYLPNLAVGQYTLAARAARWDAAASQWVAGNWSTRALNLVAPSANWTPAVVALGPADGQATSTDTLIAGQISAEGGYADVVIGIDYDVDGQIDATVTPDEQGRFYYRLPVASDPDGLTDVAVSVRAKYVDPLTQAERWGAWSDDEFVFEDQTITNPDSTLQSCGVAWNDEYDSYGGEYDDSTWSYASASTQLISGTVAPSAAAASVYVEIDYLDGDDQADGIAIPNREGHFEFYASPNGADVNVRVVEVLADGTTRYPSGDNWTSYAAATDPNGPQEPSSSPALQVVQPGATSAGGIQLRGCGSEMSVKVVVAGRECYVTPDENGFVSAAAIQAAMDDSYECGPEGTQWSQLPDGMMVSEVQLLDYYGNKVQTAPLPLLKTDDLSPEDAAEAEDAQATFFAKYNAYQGAIQNLQKSVARAETGINVQTTADPQPASAPSVGDPASTQADRDRALNTPIPSVPLPTLGGALPELEGDPAYQTAMDEALGDYHDAVGAARDALNTGFDAVIAAYNGKATAAWSEYSGKYESLKAQYDKLAAKTFGASEESKNLSSRHSANMQAISQALIADRAAALSEYNAAIAGHASSRDSQINDAYVNCSLAIAGGANVTQAERFRDSEIARFWHEYYEDCDPNYEKYQKDLIQALATYHLDRAAEIHGHQQAMARAEYSFELKKLDGIPGSDGAPGTDGTIALVQKMVAARKQYEVKVADAARDLVKGEGEGEDRVKGTAELIETYRNAVATAWNAATAAVYDKTLDVLADWALNPATDVAWSTYVTALVMHAKTEATTLATAYAARVRNEAAAERSAATGLASKVHTAAKAAAELRRKNAADIVDRDATHQKSSLLAKKEFRDEIAQEALCSAEISTADWKARQDGAVADYVAARYADRDIQYACTCDNRDLSWQYQDGQLTWEEFDEQSQANSAQAAKDSKALWVAHDTSWVTAERDYSIGIAVEGESFLNAVIAAYQDHEGDLIDAAGTYWNTSITIGAYAERESLKIQLGFARGYNAVADAFNTAANGEALAYDTAAVGAAQTRASGDNASESTFLGSYVSGFFSAVSSAYSTVTDAVGDWLRSDTADVQDYADDNLSDSTTLVSSLIGAAAGALSGTLSTYAGLFGGTVGAISKYAGKLIADTDSIETDAITKAEALARREVGARVAYLDSVNDAEAARRQKGAEIEKDRFSQNVKYAAASAKNYILESSYGGAYGYWKTDSVPVPYESYYGSDDYLASWDFFSDYGGYYSGYSGDDYGGCIGAANPIYSSYGTWYFGPFTLSEDPVPTFNATGDGAHLRARNADDRLSARKERAKATYTRDYTGIYRDAAGGSIDFSRRYLGSDIDGYKGLSGDLWSAAGTANTGLQSAVTTNDPLPAVTTFLKESSHSETALAQQSAENFGQFQIDWREDQYGVGSPEANWAAGVKSARDSFFGGLASASNSYVDAFYGAVQGYSTSMRDAGFAMDNALFAADQGFSSDSLTNWGTATVAHFDASAKKELGYLDAAITEINETADEAAGIAEDKADASQPAADQAQAVLNDMVDHVDYIGIGAPVAVDWDEITTPVEIWVSGYVLKVSDDGCQISPNTQPRTWTNADLVALDYTLVFDGTGTDDTAAGIPSDRTEPAIAWGPNRELVVIGLDNSASVYVPNGMGGLKLINGGTLDQITQTVGSTYESWQQAAEAAAATIADLRASENTARQQRETAGAAQLADRKAELAEDRKTSEKSADDAYEDEARDADNQYVLDSLDAGTSLLDGYASAIDTHTTSIRSAAATFMSSTTAAGSAYDAEYCRLQGLYLDALGLIDAGGSVSATFFDAGASSTVHVDVCFVAGTPVLLADGTTRPIEEIAVGDLVWARPHDNPAAPPRACRVAEVYRNEPAPTLRLVFAASSGERLVVEATPSHRFFIVAPNVAFGSAKDAQPIVAFRSAKDAQPSLAFRSANDAQPIVAFRSANDAQAVSLAERESTFLPAADLEPGDCCCALDCSLLTLVEKTEISQPRPVYNLQVESAHSFYVGRSPARSLWVHNDCVNPAAFTPKEIWGFAATTGMTPLAWGFDGGWSGTLDFARSTAPAQDQTSQPEEPQQQTVTLTDANGAATVLVYNPDGTLASLTDPVGNVTSYTYDSAGRLATETNPLGYVRSYEYDEAGRLVRFVDRDGNAVEYGHDARGNTISECWYDASGCLTRTIAYAFDRYDRLAAVDDAGTDYAYAYDHLGRLRSETVTRDGSVTVLHYDYDRRGQVSRVSAVVDGRADFVTEYRYDLSGRLREIAQHGVEGGNPVLAKRANIDYDRFAGTMTIRRYEGDSLVVETVQQYAWVARPDKGVANLGGVLNSASDPSRSGSPLPDMTPGTDAISFVLAGITHVGPNGQPLVGHEYAYNDSGLIESYENSIDGTSEYDYDATGQLTSADHQSQPDEQYAYDANGNRIDYAVGPANQVLCDGVYWYTYDNEGHRTERYQWIDADGDGKADREEKFDRTQYAWDARGRLVKIVTKPDGQTKSRVVHYDYDYQNRRVEKLVNDFDSDGEKTKTVERYLYTGQDIVLQTDRRGEVTHRYLHGPAVDQCLADERVLDDNILYPLFDNLGTIRDIADHDPATGQTRIVNHLVYSVYGEILSQTDPTQSTLFGFTGREIDPESDLYHYRGRYYDAALQQFLSEDPLSFWAGDPNPRRYCGNSPVSIADPSGFAGNKGYWDELREIDAQEGLWGIAKETGRLVWGLFFETVKDAPRAAAGVYEVGAGLGAVDENAEINRQERELRVKLESVDHGEGYTVSSQKALLSRQVTDESTEKGVQGLATVGAANYGTAFGFAQPGAAAAGSGGSSGSAAHPLRDGSSEFDPYISRKGSSVNPNTVGTYTTKIKWGIHQIDARPHGPGFWGKRISQKDPRVEAFELKINPNNESYYLPHPDGGFVQFENISGSIVQDGKLIMKQVSIYYVDDLPPFAKNTVLAEAERQVAAARHAGFQVEWLVSDTKAATQLENLFKSKSIPISIKLLEE